MKVLAKTLWLILFILINTKFSVSVGVCRENDQKVLESLKKQVYDPTNLLSSWVLGKDCCEWKGVVCHNRTRHVIELHIVGESYRERDVTINNLEWLPSLLKLQHLEIYDVDLSKATNWLQVINMLPSLLHLALNSCRLHNIPPLLHHNFSSLETLDLSSNDFYSSIPKWVFNIPSLIFLDLSYSQFISPYPEGHVNLTSLTTFKASGSFFHCPFPEWLLELNNLEYIELRNSRIEGAIPSKTGNITKLKKLDLSQNQLNSTIPNWLYGCKNLESLSLPDNQLEGAVSNFISNLSSITLIDLSNNMLSGKLPNLIGQLRKLEELDLSGNLFEGEISELFSNMSNFLPAVLGSPSSLLHLKLGDNKLTGTLPKSLGHHFPKLKDLDISHNMLEGVVTESQFNDLTQLKYFKASGNNLTLKVSQNWIPPFYAYQIEMGSWNIPQFPMWLQTQKEIWYVDISNAGMEGEVPTWFWNLSSTMQFCNFSHNRFVGKVPIINRSSEGHFFTLLLGSNNLSGPLPQISTSVTGLDLSNNHFSGGLSHFLCERTNESYYLSFLNLGENYLSEEIPDCWMNWPYLEVLILKGNNFVGGIPRSIGLLSDLKSMDFRGNTVTGPLPLSLENCTKLLKIDLSENELVGQLPPWLGKRLSKLKILSLRSNKFHGELPPELCHLKDLQILDLANNNFSGVIPRCINNFTATITKERLDDFTLYYYLYYDTMRESAMVTTKGNMYQYDTILGLVRSMDMSDNNLSGDIPISLTSLVGLRSFNFSKNHLTGVIPNGIGNMKELESIDLAENQLSGQIPQSLSTLSTLSYLNLSYNNLSGMIPMSTQLQSFSPSSFQGNKLCGLPLLVNCSSNGKVPNLVNENEESDEDEMNWFYISMAIGFALSFWTVSALLIFKRSWRHAYYRFVDSSWKSLLCKQA